MKKKFLLLRFSSIGDIVLCSPVIRCLRKTYPNAEIHFATREEYRSLLEPNPSINKVHLLNKNWSELIERLRAENFDQVIDLHHNFKTRKIKSALGKPSIVFNKLNIEKWIMVNFKINRLPAVHIVDRYFDALSPLGVMNDGAGLDFFIDEAEKLDVATLGLEPRKYVVFAIGGKYRTKVMPPHKIASICSGIYLPLVLAGGPGETKDAEEIKRRTAKTLVDTCGKLSIGQSASLIQQSGLVISHDTGMMHIAAAFKKEIVSIWGSTVPDFGMYPYFGSASIRNMVAEVRGLSCRPCSKLGYERCPLGHFKCMNNINEKAVQDFVNS